MRFRLKLKKLQNFRFVLIEMMTVLIDVCADVGLSIL